MSDGILSCPFCGDHRAQIAGDVIAWVECPTCNTDGPCADSDDEAIEKWNRAANQLATIAAERDKLQAFKDWVHAWLTRSGVPEDPYPQLNAVTGCRISGRLDWLKARLEAVEERRFEALESAAQEYATKGPEETDGQFLSRRRFVEGKLIGLTIGMVEHPEFMNDLPCLCDECCSCA